MIRKFATKFFFLLLLLTFFSVYTAAYEEITLYNGDVRVLSFSGISWHIGCSSLITWAKVYCLIAPGKIRNELETCRREILAVSEEENV
jgi:hypothetical protein